MINRVLIRLKIVQIVYAYYQNGGKNLDTAEKELFFSLSKAYDLYNYLLLLMVEVTKQANKALLFQLCFQLLKGQLCRADAIRKHIVDIDLKCTIPLIKGGTAADDDFHSLFRAEAKPPRVRAEHDRFHTAGLIPEGKIAVSAPGILHKISDLTSQSQIKQNVVCIQKWFDILVQGGNRDHFSHNPASRAARIETPMALSLEYCPGTK